MSARCCSPKGTPSIPCRPPKQASAAQGVVRPGCLSLRRDTVTKRNRGKFEPEPSDLYPTPMESVLPLIPHLRAEGTWDFVEPCCGRGDLARHLVAHGLRCRYQGDIMFGQDALAIDRFDATAITNLPFSAKSKPLMMDLLRHFLATAPLSGTCGRPTSRSTRRSLRICGAARRSCAPGGPAGSAAPASTMWRGSASSRDTPPGLSLSAARQRGRWHARNAEPASWRRARTSGPAAAAAGPVPYCYIGGDQVRGHR